MILYHGSYTAVSEPDVLQSRKAVDFGSGFYTTPLREQAEKWCARFLRTRGEAFLSTYALDELALQRFNVLVFDSYDGEWLDYISACRLGNDPCLHDVVIGGGADDKVFNTCELYFKGFIDKAAALDRLRFERPNSQYCFKTQAAIDSCLAYRGCVAL